MRFEAPLPIDDRLADLKMVLAGASDVVLVAPPGAGKTTRVPLALLDEPWLLGRRILLLSPRRIAARAAASGMAAQLGQKPGGLVGYRLRMETRVSSDTRVEVLTEGVFTRLLLADPMLEEVGCVIFDEFHERSLDADLGLALVLDSQSALRPDLRIVVMSATLDGARVARLLDDAPVLESRGRMHPIALRYLGRDTRRPIEDQVAEAALRAVHQETGSVLCFLPGAREIERAARQLAEQLPAGVDVRPLYGALAPEDQDAAIAPSQSGRRKVVLASSIAETSLTIEGVRVVIDSGLARRPAYDLATGLSSLKTVRASRSSADQRAGRAGRLEPGVCWRLWEEAETRSLPPFDTPEILEADLTDLVLALAEWGVSDPRQLRWLDPPPTASWEAAIHLLKDLEALDRDAQVTDLGRQISRVALPAPLAKMVLQAEDAVGLAAELAVLITEPGLCGRDLDLRARLERLRREGGRAQSARQLANRLVRQAGGEPQANTPVELAGLVLARALPGRIAKARREHSGDYLLANGRGAGLPAEEPLARERFLVVADLSGRAERAQILAAAPIDETTLLQSFAHLISSEETAELDVTTRTLQARRRRRLGRIILAEQPVERPSNRAAAEAWCSAIRTRGLALLPEAPRWRQLCARVAFCREVEPQADWPDWSDEALLNSVEAWLDEEVTAALSGVDFPQTFSERFLDKLSWEQRRRLALLAPERFETPAGGSLEILYREPAGPTVDVRLQELFGLSQHPRLGDGRRPLILRLLSPGYRPVQTTADLPGFWRGSYAEVRSQLRGRYPKHAWPEDPMAAEPTRRAKPRPS